MPGHVEAPNGGGKTIKPHALVGARGCAALRLHLREILCYQLGPFWPRVHGLNLARISQSSQNSAGCRHTVQCALLASTRWDADRPCAARKWAALLN